VTRYVRKKVKEAIAGMMGITAEKKFVMKIVVRTKA
jgi:hypothetical protein